MKILCKVKPKYDTCCVCIDEHSDRHEFIDCQKCKLHIPEYEVLKIGYTLFKGDYAIVLLDGKVERVSLDRLFDVRTVHVEEAMSRVDICGHKIMWT
jgi:hypothetical protein